MTDQLAQLRTLAAVAEAGGIARAAARIGVAKSVVSRRLADLEARLGVALVIRNAGGVSLTEAGRDLYERALRLLADLDDAEDAARGGEAEPQGLLRLTAPVTFGQLYLAAPLSAFAARHPRLQLDLDLDDRTVDLIGGGFDLAIRIGTLADSSLVARRLAPHRHLLCAAPSYLDRHGAPAHPEELKTHDALLYSNRDPNPTWRLGEGGAPPSSWRVRPRARVNNGDLLMRFALDGLGIAALPAFIAGPAIARGHLVEVLAGWAPEPGAVFAVFPGGRPPPLRVRALVDHLVQAFASKLPWDQTPDTAR